MINNIELKSIIEETVINVDGLGDITHINISEVPKENTLNIGVNECGPSDVYLRSEVYTKTETDEKIQEGIDGAQIYYTNQW